MPPIKYAIDRVNNIIDVTSVLRGFSILHQGVYKQSGDGDIMPQPAVGDMSE